MTDLAIAIGTLRRQRDTIDIAIRALEALRDGRDLRQAIASTPSAAGEGGLPAPSGVERTSQAGPAAEPGSPRSLRRLTRWAPERAAAFRAAWKRGDDTKAMAEAFGVTVNAVKVRASNEGLIGDSERDAARAKRPDPAKDRRQAFVVDWHAGLPIPELAEKYKITPASIKSWSSALGLARSEARKNALEARRVLAPRAARNPFDRPASVAPAETAHQWPEEHAAALTKLWKAGERYKDIAEALGIKPAEVIAAVAQLKLANDPDRRRAMHGSDSK